MNNLILKNYYHDKFKEELKLVEKQISKPSLLLHCCCGPCTCYPLSILHHYFDITIFYSNPNIYPKAEYDRRYETLKRFVLEYSKDNNFSITIVKQNDDFTKYMNLFKKYSNDKEGGNRCTLCHEYRLKLAMDYASKNNFDYVTTTMTVSSRKPSYLINELASQLEKQYSNIKYLYSDFKKENGTLIGINISKEYKMYRQDYCGCNFSYFERKTRHAKQD